MALVLLRAGHDVVVVDDLSMGHRDAVAPGAVFVEAGVADRARMGEVLRVHGVEAILHFAARIQVGESVSDPRRYYEGNVAASIALLDSALDAGVKRFVLSSTAAVYGDPVRVPIDEDHPTSPINPYGDTKLAIERMLAAYGRAYGLRWAALRYFNAAGADAEAGLDERHDPETHLVPIVVDVALGRRDAVTVFGDDYDTPDGTCVRDYIHVSDLVRAHSDALRHLRSGVPSLTLNCGYGHGFSVLDVIAAIKRVSGVDFKVVNSARRAGDPAQIVAGSERARATLGWQPRFDDLLTMVSHALTWERELMTRRSVNQLRSVTGRAAASATCAVNHRA
jgi:UDP-glucose 4-epimerase